MCGRKEGGCENVESEECHTLKKSAILTTLIVSKSGAFLLRNCVASMDAIPYVDSLIKEYLLFRGFTGSLRAFNRDIASDRGRGFQADQLSELIFRKLLPLDQASELMEVLEFLSSRVYSRLPGSYEGVIRKLEVNCWQVSKSNIGSKCNALHPQSLAGHRCPFCEPT